MKLHRSRTFAEHKLVARVRNALLALLLLPLVGIVVGAVVWWDLERGLLVFNLLGMALFAWFTYPFWSGSASGGSSSFSPPEACFCPPWSTCALTMR